MSTGPDRPPAPARRAHTVALVQAVVCGAAALIVFLLTLATYTQDDPPDGRTLSDVGGALALEGGAVLLAVAVWFTAQRFGRGSDAARLGLVALEVAVGLAGAALAAVSLRHGPAGGGGVWLLVLVPAVVAVVALVGGDTRRWCADPARGER